MLNDYQITRVWEGMIAAETRALYFGDLTARHTRQKQWITGLSFFLSSGAAASIIAQFPAWIAASLALIVAAITAYAMAVNLDGRIATMSKLQASWSQIANLYDHLWNHTNDDDAESQLSKIIEREREPSELAATSAPNDEKLMARWETRVFAMRHLDPA